MYATRAIVAVQQSVETSCEALAWPLVAMAITVAVAAHPLASLPVRAVAVVAAAAIVVHS